MKSAFGFNTEVLADYNSDKKIDVSDLSLFVGAWTNGDLSLELGPASGVVPHLIPAIDGVMDIWDISAFTRMWHWSHGNTALLARYYPLAGTELQLEQTANNLTVQVPDNTIAGEIVLQYETTGADVSFGDSESQERIVITSKDAAMGQLTVAFGYLGANDKKQITFDTEYYMRESIGITVSYISMRGTIPLSVWVPGRSTSRPFLNSLHYIRTIQILSTQPLPYCMICQKPLWFTW